MAYEDLDSSAFDVEAFESVKKIMKDRLGLMLECYLEDTQMYFSQIAEGLKKKNVKQILAAAHTVKSSSRQLGAVDVSDLALKMETLARDTLDKKTHMPDEVPVLLEKLKNAFEVVRPRFEAEIKRSSKER